VVRKKKHEPAQRAPPRYRYERVTEATAAGGGRVSRLVPPPAGYSNSNSSIAIAIAIAIITPATGQRCGRQTTHE